MHPEGGPNCGHEPAEGQLYCPFHSPETSAADFAAHLAQLIEQDDFNWVGFLFPSDLDLSYTEAPELMLSFARINGTLSLAYGKFNQLKLDRALIKGDFDASHSQIREHVACEGLTINGRTDFSHSRVGTSDFSLAHFNQEADFVGMRLNDRGLFGMSIFEDKADFSYAFFNGEVRFQGTLFMDRCVFFRTRLGRASFSSTEMARISFSNADVREVILTGAIFPSDDVLDEERSAIYSEDFARAEGVYRALKQNLQSTGDYEAAGRFFIREMECRRRQLWQKHRFTSWFWYSIMKALCKYGESPPRIFVAVGLNLLVFAIFFALVGVKSADGVYSLFQLPPGGVGDMLWQACYLSIITFTTVGYGDLTPVVAGQALAAVESLFGVFLTAMFVVTFTRRLSR